MTDMMEPKKLDNFTTESPIRAFTDFQIAGVYAIGKGFRPSLAHLARYLDALESKEGWSMMQVILPQNDTTDPTILFHKMGRGTRPADLTMGDFDEWMRGQGFSLVADSTGDLRLYRPEVPSNPYTAFVASLKGDDEQGTWAHPDSTIPIPDRFKHDALRFIASERGMNAVQLIKDFDLHFKPRKNIRQRSHRTFYDQVMFVMPRIQPDELTRLMIRFRASMTPKRVVGKSPALAMPYGISALHGEIKDMDPNDAILKAFEQPDFGAPHDEPVLMLVKSNFGREHEVSGMYKDHQWWVITRMGHPMRIETLRGVPLKWRERPQHDWTVCVEPIPELVYWNGEAGNFYGMVSRRGQGQTFFDKWWPRYAEFPTSPADEETSAVTLVTCDLCKDPIDPDCPIQVCPHMKIAMTSGGTALPVTSVPGSVLDDPLNPKHYAGRECADIGERLSANGYQILKYCWRLGKKDDACQELGKAQWYGDSERSLLITMESVYNDKAQMPFVKDLADPVAFLEDRIDGQDEFVKSVARMLWSGYNLRKLQCIMEVISERKFHLECGRGLAI